VVDAGDPAFDSPTKPIGPVYGPAEAAAIATARGWAVRPDGARWRRVVASPEPTAIVEIETIRLLVDAGVLVVCAGGGGPKVEAASRIAEATGNIAVIGSLNDAAALLEGEAGTLVHARERGAVGA
jgi:carbamate kinase